MEQHYVIYSRKSKFTGKGESVENQVEMCKNYLAVHFGEEAARDVLVYEDEGFSGGNLERPQFKKMMRDSHKVRFKAILVYRLDRISRNIGDFAGLIQELGDRGIDFISIKEQFDTSSPMGRAMMYIASVFSQLERETIAERIRDNMQELAKTGRWLGGITPMGYESEGVTKVTIDGKTKKAFKLVPIPEEIQMVTMIYDKFLETGSLTKTDQYLLEGRYRTRRGNEFCRFTIRAILTNPVYMIADQDAYGYLKDCGVDLFAAREQFDGTRGVMAYNRTLQKPGKTNEIRPMEEWIVALGAHQGIIPGAKWIQVQKMLNMNRSKNFRRARTNEALLSGLLFCGDCGAFMRPKLTDRLDDRGERIYTYRCTTKDRTQGHNCNIQNLDGRLLDERVLQEVVSLGRDPDKFLEDLETCRHALCDKREDYEKEQADLSEQLKANEKDIAALMTSLPKYVGTDMEGYITNQISAMHANGEGLRKRLSDLETMIGESALYDYQYDVLRDMIIKVGSQIESLSVEQKRNALRLVVNRIIWDGENVHIYFLHDAMEERDKNIGKIVGNMSENSENTLEKPWQKYSE